VILMGVRLRNWKRYKGEHEVELTGGVYALVARAEEDPERSNWLGKTSFIEAVWYGLTGDVPADATLDGVVSHGEPDMSVELEFDDGVFLARDRDVARKQSKLTLCLPDGDTETKWTGDAAQDELYRRIGMGKKDLKATCFVRQKQMDKLVTDDPADVTAAINGWLDMARVEKAAALAAAGATKAEQDLERLAVELNTAQATLSVEPLAESLAAEVTRLEGELADYQAAQEQRVQHAKLDGEWRLAQQRCEQYRLAQERVAKQREALESFARVNRELLGANVVGWCQREADERAALVVIANEEERNARTVAAGQFDGACPVAGIDCPAKDRINAGRTEACARHEKARAAARLAQDALAKARGALAPYQEAARSRDRLAAEAGAAERALPKQPPPDPGPRPVEPEIPMGGADAARQLADYQAAQRRRAELEPRVEKLTAALEDARAVAEAHRLAQRVLGRKGVQRVIAQRACVVLEHGANERLVTAGVDLRLTLAWGRETQVLETTCSACGQAFPKSARVKECARCGEQRGNKSDERFHVERSSSSGAADDLAGLALQLSAASWLRRARGCPWGVLVLDEPFGALDPHHRRALAASLTRMVGAEYGQAFVVAHDRETLDALPRRLLVTASGPWSRIEVA
jgi:DNA repair exonuclease SbcCD ATPase subunit